MLAKGTILVKSETEAYEVLEDINPEAILVDDFCLSPIGDAVPLVGDRLPKWMVQEILRKRD